MTTEQQNHAWASLPKAERDAIKVEYRKMLNNPCLDKCDSVYLCAFENIFGKHNLTSDTEPEESFIVLRKDIQATYAYNEQILKYDPEHKGAQLLKVYLEETYGDKCLPDKQPSIASTEETKDETKGTMEEKELNICELLKGCEGEEIFSISVGKVIFRDIYDYDDIFKVRTLRKDAIGNEYSVPFYSDGRRNKNGLNDLYPTEELLRKYPLDPYSAWMEWKEARKPKRWRAERGGTYWYIDSINHPCQGKEEGMRTDSTRYCNGNYFRTVEEAEQATEGVKKYLQKFHEKKGE